MLQEKSLELFTMLEKFENIKVKKIDRISQEDKFFCEKIQKEYNLVKNQLEKYLKNLTELKDEDKGNPYHVEKSYHNRSGYISCAGDQWYHRLMFSPLYAIEKIEKNLETARLSFISQIISYFETTYHLSLKESKTLQESDSPVSYEKVVDFIIDQCGGLSLTEKGITKLKDDFIHSIYYKKKIIVKSAKITLEDYAWLRDNYSGGKTFDYDCKQMAYLKAALCYFETGTATLIPNITSYFPSSSGRSEIDFENEYTFANTDKVLAIKFFKNRRVDIRFKDKVTATDFYEKLELYKVEKN